MKSKKYNLKLDIFRKACLIVITDDMTLANEKYKLTDRKDFDNVDGYTHTEFCDGWALIMIKDNIGINVIVHEATHFVNALFKSIGYTPSLDNDEIQSYLLAHVCEKIENFLKDFKKTNN